MKSWCCHVFFSFSLSGDVAPSQPNPTPICILGNSMSFLLSRSSPQANKRTKPASFASLPWLRDSKIAALSSPAVFMRCEGCNSSVMFCGTLGGKDGREVRVLDEVEATPEAAAPKARSVIVRSSSRRKSGLASPLGASSACAKVRASAVRPWRMCSIKRCC